MLQHEEHPHVHEDLLATSSSISEAPQGKVAITNRSGPTMVKDLEKQIGFC